MIEIGTVASWINWESPTEISNETLPFIETLQDPELTDDQRRDILQDVYSVVRRTTNMLERAEILIYCGAQAFELNMIEDAGRWIDTAATNYEHFHDNHRFAVALWMLFIVRRRQGHYRVAFSQAVRARNFFIEKASERAQKKQIEEESWYRGRIIDMTCDLVSSPEDMYELLFEFSGSKLSPSAMDIRNKVSTYLERRQFARIEQEIQLLLGITIRSSNPQETAEAFSFCGVVAWLLDEKEEAVNFLRSAMTLYVPNSFEYAVLEWMLGLALFKNKLNYAMAIQMMERSIQDIESQRLKAIRENELDKSIWFAAHHLAMKRILRTNLEGMG